MTFLLVGLDPGETTGVCALLVPDSLALPDVRVVACERVHAPTQTKRLEGPAMLDLAYGDKIGARLATLLPLAHALYCDASVGHESPFNALGLTQVAIEWPIDARPHWQRQNATRRESGDTRFGQGVNYRTALAGCHTGLPDAPITAYPVRGRKGTAGWQGGRTARVIGITCTAFLHAAGWTDEVSEHELMACGVALHHLNCLARDRGRALATGSAR